MVIGIWQPTPGVGFGKGIGAGTEVEIGAGVGLSVGVVLGFWGDGSFDRGVERVVEVSWLDVAASNPLQAVRLAITTIGTIRLKIIVPINPP
jgi:hypothetical protein